MNFNVLVIFLARLGFGSCHSFGVVVGLCGYGMCQMRGDFLTRPEKSLQCGRIILPQGYTLFLILNTVYICFRDETDVSNAGEQLARDKSSGDEVIRRSKHNLLKNAKGGLY
jgi:hypothetical protein